jgi:glycosyltransferase involved in cell wall biosynthesis
MAKKLTSLSIFMPAYNEEGNIAVTIIDAERAAKQVAEEYEIIVVNDGSRDKTAEIVGELSRLNPHIRLVSHSLNRGYGAAVKTGMKACRKDWVFFTDSDGQFHYDELGKFVAATESTDLVMGYRKKRMDPFHRVFVAQVLLKIWNFVLFGLTVRDVDCAYKLFSRQVRDAITLKPRAPSRSRVYHRQGLGFRIKQLPVSHYARRFGEQTGGNWRSSYAATESLSYTKDTAQ